MELRGDKSDWIIIKRSKIYVEMFTITDAVAFIAKVLPSWKFEPTSKCEAA